MDIGLNLEDEAIDQVGAHEPIRVGPDTSTRRAFQLLREARRGELLICQGEALVGIFTERDALRVLAGKGDLDAPISRFMTSNPATIRAEDTISTAVVKMATNGYRRLPVVDADGRPSGVISVAGVVHWLVEHFPEAVYNLSPVSRPSTRDREGP